MLVAVRLARVGGSQVSGSEEELALLRRSWTSVLHVSQLPVSYTHLVVGPHPLDHARQPGRDPLRHRHPDHAVPIL